MKKAGIYIHIPFCVKKCNYCDFASVGVGRAFENSDREQAYLSDLLCEIEQAKEMDDWIVDSVFFGGGTPSVVSPLFIEKVLCKLKEHYRIADDAEISMELNPGTTNQEKLFALFAAGINRLSIGMQSANDRELKMLGRIHNYSDFLETYEYAKKAGFLNINVDVMTALPSQTASQVAATLEKMIRLSPAHLSVYSLILEEGTEFYVNQDKLKLPTEEEIEEIDQVIRTKLMQAGYQKYEISNYAKEGFACRHNIKYWKRQPYRGFGLSAASLIIRENGENLRFTNCRDFERYHSEVKLSAAKKKYLDEYRVLAKQEQMEEFVFLGMRMTEGISSKRFFACFQENLFQVFEKPLSMYLKNGLICSREERDNCQYFFSEHGMEVSNEILADFLLDY